MNDKLLLEKLQTVRKSVESFRVHHKKDPQDIHQLRVSCREIFSLISPADTFYSQLKKVIKRTNEVRDIDVFFDIYLKSLPKKYSAALDLQTIRNTSLATREKKVTKLHRYLKSLSIPKTLNFIYIEPKDLETLQHQLTSPNDKALHKYRIYIKKRFYKESNSSPLKRKKVEHFKQIKNLLGAINDNNNGLKRLTEYNIKPALLKKIDSFTKKTNMKLFKKFKELDSQQM